MFSFPTKIKKSWSNHSKCKYRKISFFKKEVGKLDIRGQIYAPVNWTSPPPRRVGPGSGIVREWTLYWTKCLPKGVQLLTTIDPLPRHTVVAITFSCFLHCYFCNNWKLEQIQCNCHTVTIWSSSQISYLSEHFEQDTWQVINWWGVQ